MRGAGSLGKPTSLQGKLCYSQGGLIIEEQQAQQQVRLNFLETLRCPVATVSVIGNITRSAGLGVHMYQGR